MKGFGLGSEPNRDVSMLMMLGPRDHPRLLSSTLPTGSRTRRSDVYIPMLGAAACYRGLAWICEQLCIYWVRDTSTTRIKSGRRVISDSGGVRGTVRPITLNDNALRMLSWCNDALIQNNVDTGPSARWDLLSDEYDDATG